MPSLVQASSGLLQVQLGPDPRTRKRSVPMQVLSLGFSRTGTSSMQAALEILGYGPVTHGRCIIFNILELEMVGEGLKAKFTPEKACCKPFGREEFDQLIGEYRAVTDGPFCHFGPELMAAYPQAKVILVERDIDSWFTSYLNTVCTIPFRRSFQDKLVNFLNPDLGRQRKASDAMFGAAFDANSKEEMIAHSRDVYQQHYLEIRKAARPGQILEYKLGSGWEPLCKFLGKPVPDAPFPRKNDGAAFQGKITSYRFLFVMRALEKLGLGLAGAVATVITIKYLGYGNIEPYIRGAKASFIG
ncbi:P-loop containing nucleoside triphosphate hydrolase protein [Xylariales sp. AK1849]|nr:P-loop containing nucleoside triphosphate hydrolase protein [Xylariales sp. AK1849]